MKTLLAAALMLALTACGTDSSATPTIYSLSGRWVVYSGTPATIVGVMHFDAATGTGHYAEGYTGYPSYLETGPIFDQVSGLAFAPSAPDFSVTFSGPAGQRVVVGQLLAESSSAVFRGSVNGAAVTATRTGDP